jgi:hypothetical protein
MSDACNLAIDSLKVAMVLKGLSPPLMNVLSRTLDYANTKRSRVTSGVIFCVTPEREG